MKTKPKTPHQQAVEAGLAQYWSGKPCRKGHDVPRYTANRHCVVCHIESQRLLRVNEPEKIRAAERARYAANPEPGRAKGRLRYAKKPAEVRATSAAWQKNNFEKRKGYWKVWAAKNPEKVLQYSVARRAAVEAGSVSVGIIADLYRKQDSLCACPCRRSLAFGYDVDHIRPLSRGGKHEDGNLQLLTPNCNARKHAKDDAVFKAMMQAEITERENGRRS